MTIDVERSTDGKSYDLIVIGGGIYGVCLALESARRGLSPLLIERDEFGKATSDNTLRILHGGLRYLQSFDFRRFHESVRERTWFLRQFPDLVRPLGFLMPLYGRGLRRPTVFRLALSLNNYLSRHCNEGLREDCQLPASTVLTRDETIERFPDVEQDGLLGAGCWHDALMLDPRQLLHEILDLARNHGAVCLSQIEATKLLAEGDRVTGIEGYDHRSSSTATIRAGVVVNCAGPWCRELAATFDRQLPNLFQPSLAFNVLLNRQPLSEYGLAVSSKATPNRSFFLIPNGDHIHTGTYHTTWIDDIKKPRPSEQQVDVFLNELNQAVPGLRVTERDVLRVDAGLIPAVASGSDRATCRWIIHDHGNSRGPRGLFSVSGVKFTTARDVAEKTIQRIFPNSKMQDCAPDEFTRRSRSVA